MHKLNFSFVLMVLVCRLVRLTLNWRVVSASVQNELFDEMANQFAHVSREQFLPKCQSCNGVHVHLQFIESLDVVELHIFFCSCHFLAWLSSVAPQN